jgi:hypothetical protein
MRRTHRVIIASLAGAVVIGTFLLLTYAGRSSEGPLSRVLTSIGAGVSSAERRVTQRFRGAGRAGELQWLAPYRADARRLRNPDRVLVGAYDAGMPASLEGAVQLEKTLGTTFALLQFYSAWGDKPEQQFPLRAVQAIAELGSVPVITWEPWLVDFDSRLHPDLPLRDDRDRGGLASIARGMYDFYIDAWAADAAKYGQPLLIRFGHEMNDPYRYPWGPQNNSAADYVAAWRHVIDRFRTAGARNVLFVWAPHLAYKGYEAYYPGDSYTDWIGTGVLNFGKVARWSDWWSFREIFGQKYPTLARYKKPVMIAELGSLAYGGDRNAWYRDAFRDFTAKYPRVKAVLFFNVPHDATVTYQGVDWTFARDTEVVATVSRALKTVQLTTHPTR